MLGVASLITTRDSKGRYTTSVISGGQVIGSSSYTKQKGTSRRQAQVDNANEIIVGYNTAQQANAGTTTTYFDASGRKLSPYEAAAIQNLSSRPANISTEYGPGYSTGSTTFVKTKEGVVTIETPPSQPSPRDFVPLPSSGTTSTATRRPSVMSASTGDQAGTYLREPSQARKTLSYAGRVIATGAANNFVTRSVANTVSAVRTDPIGALGFVTAGSPQLASYAARSGRLFFETSPVGQGIKTGVRATGKLLSNIPTQAGRNIAGFTLNVVTTGAISRIARKGGEASLNLIDKEAYALVGSGKARDAYTGALDASTPRMIDRIAARIPFGDVVVKPEENPAYEASLRAYAEDQGVAYSTLSRAVTRERQISRGSFAAGLWNANTWSEVGGQVAFAQGSAYAVKPASQASGMLFREGFAKIFPQGFSEGAASVVAEQVSRGKNLRTMNYAAVGAGALTGAFGAGIIGGGLVVTSVKKTKILGLSAARSIETVSNTIDPYEMTGDYVAGLGGLPGSSFYKYRGGIVFVPGAQTSSFASTASETVSDARSQGSRTRTPSVSFVSQNALVNTYTPVTTLAQTRSVTRTQPYVRPFSGVLTTSRTNPLVRSFTSVQTLSYTTVPTLSQVPVTTRTNVRTDTRVQTPVRTNVLVAPLTGWPLAGGGGGSGWSLFSRTKQRKEYTPTLSAAVFDIRALKAPGKELLRSGLTIRPLVN